MSSRRFSVILVALGLLAMSCGGDSGSSPATVASGGETTSPGSISEALGEDGVVVFTSEYEVVPLDDAYRQAQLLFVDLVYAYTDAYLRQWEVALPEDGTDWDAWTVDIDEARAAWLRHDEILGLFVTAVDALPDTASSLMGSGGMLAGAVQTAEPCDRYDNYEEYQNCIGEAARQHFEGRVSAGAAPKEVLDELRQRWPAAGVTQERVLADIKAVADRRAAQAGPGISEAEWLALDAIVTVGLFATGVGGAVVGVKNAAGLLRAGRMAMLAYETAQTTVTVGQAITIQVNGSKDQNMEIWQDATQPVDTVIALSDLTNPGSWKTLIQGLAGYMTATGDADNGAVTQLHLADQRLEVRLMRTPPAVPPRLAQQLSEMCRADVQNLLAPQDDCPLETFRTQLIQALQAAYPLERYIALLDGVDSYAGTYTGVMPYTVPDATGGVAATYDIPFVATVLEDGSMQASVSWTAHHDFGQGIGLDMSLEAACTGAVDAQGVVACAGSWLATSVTTPVPFTFDDPGTFTVSGSITDDTLTGTLDKVGGLGSGSFPITATRQPT